jgi:hypothetical protein
MSAIPRRWKRVRLLVERYPDDSPVMQAELAELAEAFNAWWRTTPWGQSTEITVRDEL